MTSVEANTDFIVDSHLAHDLRQLFEPATDLAALAGHRLQQNSRVHIIPHDLIQDFSYHLDTCPGPLADMRTGVEIVIVARRVLHPP